MNDVEISDTTELTKSGKINAMLRIQLLAIKSGY